MYNSGRRGKRTNDGYGVISTADNFNQSEYPIPTVTSFSITDGSYNPLPDSAVDTAGGQTIVVNGSGFRPGATVMVGGNTIGVVTYIDQGRLAFTAPALTSASYTIIVTNSNGGTGILVPGLVYSGLPTWSTSAGSVGSVYETKPISQSFVATGDVPLTYALYSGSIPSGSTLESDGTLSGTAPADSGSTTYSFTIRAYDAQNQHSDRSFSLTINTDTVTWSTPTDNQVISAYEYRPITNVTASATSAAGYGVLYTANTVPGTVTLNANTGLISGNIGVAGNTYTQLTATANTTVRNATRNVIFNSRQDVVTWTTPNTNQVITAYEYTPITNVTANATSAAGFGVLYSSNAIPTGITIDANTGLISGTANTVGNTFSRLTATANTSARSNTQDVIFNVNQDVVTWSSPADQTAYSLVGGSAMANVTLSATSAAGRSITYTANALPSGVGLSGSVIYGTPDSAQTVTTLLTATAATTNRSATRTISWSVSLGDSNWKNVSLLLNGVTSSNTFINDASLNNAHLTVVGDTKPNNLHPYNGSYYSNYFDGTGDNLGTTTSSSAFTFGTGDFTIEFWVNWSQFANAIGSEPGIFQTSTTSGGFSTSYTTGVAIIISEGAYNVVCGTSYAGRLTGTYTTTFNSWDHVAVVRSSGTLTLYINGVNRGSQSNSNNITATYAVIGGYYTSDFVMNGYLSNFRIVKGTAVYTTAFTPSTTPLTSVANTVLLTCQSNRFIDTSLNNLTVTKNGDTKVVSANPFTTPTTVPYNTQYSTYFDGTGDNLTIPSNTVTDISSGDFTVEFWTNVNAVTGDISQYFVDSYFTGINRFMIYAFNNTLVAQWISAGAGKTITTTIVANTWYHVAFVKNGTSYKLYLNGSSVGTPVTDADTLTSGNCPITIGRSTVGGGPVKGFISNFRIVKGTAVYTSNFTPSTTPLTAISGTSVLTCQSPTIIDNSTNALDITSTADARPIAVSPFTMTTSNTTVTSLGSAYFDGTGDYLTIPNNLGLYFTAAGNNTFECWVNIPDLSTTKTILWNRYGAAGWSLTIASSTGYVNFITYEPTARTLTSTSGVATNTWTHIAVVRVSSTVTLYINGVSVGTLSSQSSGENETTQPINIGAGNSGGNVFKGYIADVRFVKGTALYTANFLPPQTPLTPVTNTQLLTLQYNGGATNNGFVDQSSFNNIITRNGNVTQGTFSPYSQTGWSNYFDGSGDYLLVTNNTALQLGNTYTVEAWVYSNAYGNNLRIVSDGSSSGNDLDLGVYNTGVIFFAGGYTEVGGGYTLPLGTWVHIAVVVNAGALSIYVNGTARTLVGQTTSFNHTNTGNKNIGAVSGGNSWNGYISNVRFLKGTALYTSNFTPSTTPLTAIANTSLLTCQSNRLIDNSPNNFTITKNGDVSVQAYSPFGGVTSVPTSYSNYFDGTSDYLTIPASTQYNFGTGDFTVEFWINSTDTDAVIAAQLNAGGTNWCILVTGTNLYWQNSYQAASLLYFSYQLTGQWTHIAYVRRLGTLRCYINGTEAGSINDTTNYAGNGNLQIGSGGYGDLLGYISNFRIVKGTAVYTSNFTPPTSPLTAIANTTLLTCQSSTMIDNSVNKSTITSNGTTVRAVNPFGMTNTTQVAYSPSVNGGSMYFDGTGDYLSVPLTLGTSDFTIETYVYMSSLGSEKGIFQLSDSTSPQAAYGYICLYHSSTGGYGMYVNGLNTTGGNASYTQKANSWAHLAVVKTSGSTKLYIDGVRYMSLTDTYNYGSKYLLLGAFYSASNLLNGYLSDFKVTLGALYTSNFYPPAAPLTPTQTIGANTFVSSLHLTGTSGGIVDAHGTNILETVSNTQLTSEDPYNGGYYSNYFAGSNDYLSPTKLDFGTADFTVEAWVYPLTVGGPNGNDNQILYISTGSNTRLAFRLNSLNKMDLYLNAVTPGVTTYTSNTVLSIGRWYHLAAVRTSGMVQLYVDGVLNNTPAASTHDINNNTTYSYIGSIGVSTQPFVGNISNLRITNTAVYTSNFTPSSVPLTAISGTRLLTCQSNKFVDNSTNPLSITRSSTIGSNLAVKSFNPFRQNTGKSLYFDGTEDYMTSKNNSLCNFPADFTIEFWALKKEDGASSYDCVVGCDSAGGGLNWFLELSSSRGFLFFAGSSSRIANNSISINDNAWHFYAISRQNGTLRIFQDGVKLGTDVTYSSAILSNGDNLWIGREGTYYFKGYISDLRITNGVARYTSTFTPPTTTFQVK